MMAAFDQAFGIVIGEEGGLSMVRTDPGNWTGGRVGVGELRGTKYGISAAAFPALDIANLTLEGAKVIYKSKYWDVVKGDELPPPLALLVFDAAVNSGPGRAVKWLQAAVGAKPDGEVGPRTLEAVAAAHGRGAAILAEMTAQRLVFLASLPTWHVFALGWARRVVTLQIKAAGMVA